MRVPFLDLTAQYRALQSEIRGALDRVLERGRFILGPEVEAFEAEFAAYLGVPYAVGVASGTDGLTLALQALGIGPGDEVITVSHTAVATVTGIERAGARPVLVDIDPATWTIDPEAVRVAITDRTRAVVVVHLYGNPADLDTIQAICQSHGLYLVEDACQAHGARYRHRRVGTIGHVGVFSFYPTKNLGGYGDGGMVVTADPTVAERLRRLREYGWRQRFVSEEVGTNSRLDEIQAACLRVKLPHLDEWNERRRSLASLYREALRDTPVRFQGVLPEAEPVYHLFVIQAPDRDGLQAFLTEHGIGTMVHYPQAVHQQPAYRRLGGSALPVTERIVREVLSLPLYPELSETAVEYVADRVRAFYRK